MHVTLWEILQESLDGPTLQRALQKKGNKNRQKDGGLGKFYEKIATTLTFSKTKPFVTILDHNLLWNEAKQLLTSSRPNEYKAALCFALLVTYSNEPSHAYKGYAAWSLARLTELYNTTFKGQLDTTKSVLDFLHTKATTIKSKHIMMSATPSTRSIKNSTESRGSPSELSTARILKLTEMRPIAKPSAEKKEHLLDLTSPQINILSRSLQPLELKRAPSSNELTPPPATINAASFANNEQKPSAVQFDLAPSRDQIISISLTAPSIQPIDKHEELNELIRKKLDRLLNDMVKKGSSPSLKQRKNAQADYLIQEITQAAQFDLVDLKALSNLMENVQRDRWTESRFDDIRDERLNPFGDGNTDTWHRIRTKLKHQIITLLKQRGNKLSQEDFLEYGTLMSQHTGRWYSHFGKTKSFKLFQQNFEPITLRL